MDEGPTARRPTKVLVGAVVLFLLAVVLGRLLIAGTTAAWVAFALALPIVVFVLTAAVSFRFGLVVAAVFSLAVLGIRFFLQRNPLGWIALMLLPVIALTGLLVGRVLAQMRRDRRGGEA